MVLIMSAPVFVLFFCCSGVKDFCLVAPFFSFYAGFFRTWRLQQIFGFKDGFIILNHLGCIKPKVNNGITYQPTGRPDFFPQQYISTSATTRVLKDLASLSQTDYLDLFLWWCLRIVYCGKSPFFTTI